MAIVLVHGAFHGAWVWDAVEAELAHLGLSAVAVELPLTGFPDDMAAARSAIEAAGAGAVVCAHSYGGLVLSAAARGLPVRHLVYLAAFMVDEDEDWASLWFSIPTLLHEALVLEEHRTGLDVTKVPECFYGDSSADVVQKLLPRLRDMPPFGAAPVDQAAPAWHDIASTFIVCARDRAIHPELQRAMARHAGITLEWESDHSPFLTRPREIADLLASYETSVVGT